MLRLYVMRHAKSSWAIPGARDFDRELNDRGQSDLVKLAHTDRVKSLAPELIVCSSAVRTNQTLEGILPAFERKPEIVLTEKLYSSGLDDYMRLIQSIEDKTSVMVIGHNPMCGALASSLSGKGDPEFIEQISYKYPTGTIAVIEFSTENWSEIASASGTLVDLIIPSKLDA